MLEATILMDNIAGEDFISEWGFSVSIRYNGRHILLDTGSSDKYLKNAEKLGIDLGTVECSVLSHAHYDHSTGYAAFFEKNPAALLYVSSSCAEDCYHRLGFLARRYVGIPKGMLRAYPDRIRMVEGLYELGEGVWLVPHLENGLETIGRRAHLYRKEGWRLVPDNFAHEQSLVFDTEQGLVVFNSCSHGGLPNILADIRHYLPGKKIYMTVGGLHLSTYGSNRVREIAEMIRELDIAHVVTGHCTGEKAFGILKEVLGDKVEQTYVGMALKV